MSLNLPFMAVDESFSVSFHWCRTLIDLLLFTFSGHSFSAGTIHLFMLLSRNLRLLIFLRPIPNMNLQLYLRFQSFPVAASSLCLLMLSLDRYATVKHPRFTQLRQRQYLPSVLAFVSWFGASVLCAPFLLVYKVAVSPLSSSSSSSPNGLQFNPTTTFPSSDGKIINEKKLCVSDYGSDEWHFVFVVSYVGFAFIVPCCGVIFNHLGRSIKHNVW